MKWLKLLSLVLALGCLLVPVTVQAANPVVHITVSAWVVGAPSGLTITYVSDYQVDLEWLKGEAAANTMVRAKYGSEPVSRTDGYEVYYGDGTSCSDTGVNFEESASTVYYRLFSQNGAGAWEKEGISGFLENPNMLLIALIVLSLGLMVASYMLKKSFLAFAACGAWFILAIYSFTRWGATFDIYWALTILSGALTIGSAFVPMSFREAAGGEEEPLDPDMEDLKRFSEEQRRERGQYGFLYGSRRARRRPSSRGTSLYR
jgi:hypothetical protein